MNQGHADTDITVEAANGRTMTINAHCLAACSQHFHRMLFGEQGSKEQSERRVVIPDFSEQSVRAYLELTSIAHTGLLPTPTHFLLALPLISKYQADGLKALCCRMVTAAFAPVGPGTTSRGGVYPLRHRDGAPGWCDVIVKPV